MRRTSLASALLLAVFGVASVALAHHSFNFFRSEEGGRFVIGEGTILETRLVNPHSGVFVETINENGDSEVWGIETRPAVFLLRRGWTEETLQAGQRVTFAGERLREHNRAWWRAMLIPGSTPDAEARLFIEVEALDQPESAAFTARFDALPPCNGISEFCYRVSREALDALQDEYGAVGYLTPEPAAE